LETTIQKPPTKDEGHGKTERFSVVVNAFSDELSIANLKDRKQYPHFAHDLLKIFFFPNEYGFIFLFFFKKKKETRTLTWYVQFGQLFLIHFVWRRALPYFIV
jgi:hypothetical protein